MLFLTLCLWSLVPVFVSGLLVFSASSFICPPSPSFFSALTLVFAYDIVLIVGFSGLAFAFVVAFIYEPTGWIAAISFFRP